MEAYLNPISPSSSEFEPLGSGTEASILPGVVNQYLLTNRETLGS